MEQGKAINHAIETESTGPFSFAKTATLPPQWLWDEDFVSIWKAQNEVPE